MSQFVKMDDNGDIILPIVTSGSVPWHKLALPTKINQFVFEKNNKTTIQLSTTVMTAIQNHWVVPTNHQCTKKSLFLTTFMEPKGDNRRNEQTFPTKKLPQN